MNYLRKDFFNLDTKIRVVIYARVSTEHEAQISALENQIQYYDNILKEHPNWILVERYIDRGITGTSILKRDAFMKMIRDSNNDCFDLVITREVARYARNTADTLVEVRKLVNKGIGVYFTEDSIFASLYSKDEWELKLSLMATLAQNESKKISVRVKAGQKISFENGVFYGNGNILGYDRIGKDMIVNKEQAATVRRMFDLYLSGHGLRKIQFILEQEGYKTATGLTKWSSSVISKTLRNSFYCGRIEYRKQFTPDYLEQKKINNKGEVEKVVVKGTHEPIITEEEFDKVQQMMSGKSLKRNGKKVGHNQSSDVFCRKIICSCGRCFNRRRGYTTKGGENRYLYQCYGQLQNGTVTTRKNKGLDTSDCCTSMTVPNWKLELTADWIFRRFFDNKQLIYERTMEMLEEAFEASSNVNDVVDEINACKDAIASAEEKYSSIVDLYVEGHIPKEIYLTKVAKLDEVINKYKEELCTLEEKLVRVQDENNILERKRAIADFLSVKPFKKETAIPMELIEYFVKSITVYDEEMVWTLRVPKGVDLDKLVKVKSVPKKEISTVTDPKNHEFCSSQDRLLLTTLINNESIPETSETLVNMGTFNISSNYFNSVKSYYFDVERVPRHKDFEVSVNLMV